MGDLADTTSPDTPPRDLLRLENLDINVAPHPAVLATAKAAIDSHSSSTTTSQPNTLPGTNSYLPFTGQLQLRNTIAKHINTLSGVSPPYTGRSNVVITAGGLNGIANALLATVQPGDEVILTDPTYIGLINRVHLAGATPTYAHLTFTPGSEWTLDQPSLIAAITPRTKALLLMSPALPTGCTFTHSDWTLVASLCTTHDLWLIYDAAMERLLFDSRPLIHPAGLTPSMRERTITVGSASKELRMIGWRVGWIVAPEALIPDLAAVGIANVVVPVGMGQEAASIGLANDDLSEWVAELQRRRDLLVDVELKGLDVGKPGGGLALVLRTDRKYGLKAKVVSERLMGLGVCVTAMEGWGSGRAEVGEFVRFVYSNEGVERLRGLGVKVRMALGLVGDAGTEQERQ